MVGNGGLKSEQNSSGSETSTVPQTREPVSSSFSPFSPWKNNTLGSNDLRTSWNRSNVGFTSVWTCIKIKTITLSQTIAKTSRKTKRTHKPQVDQKTQAPGRDKKPDSSPPPFACRQTPRTKPRGGYNWASATQSYWTFYSHHNSQKTQKNYKLKPKNIALESLKSQKKNKKSTNQTTNPIPLAPKSNIDNQIPLKPTKITGKTPPLKPNPQEIGRFYPNERLPMSPQTRKRNEE